MALFDSSGFPPLPHRLQQAREPVELHTRPRFFDAINELRY